MKIRREFSILRGPFGQLILYIVYFMDRPFGIRIIGRVCGPPVEKEAHVKRHRLKHARGEEEKLVDCCVRMSASVQHVRDICEEVGKRDGIISRITFLFDGSSIRPFGKTQTREPG
jgi:hypothetical protein